MVAKHTGHSRYLVTQTGNFLFGGMAMSLLRLFLVYWWSVLGVLFYLKETKIHINCRDEG